MSCPDLADIAGLRIAGEHARLHDVTRLATLLSCGTLDGWLQDRVDRREKQVAGLMDRPDPWESWHEDRAGSDLLIDELMATLMTALVRQCGADGGMLAVAESLLAELVTLAGIEPLTLGQTQELESIDHSRRTVTMRFPGSRVWELPFLCHEFGHHAVRQVRHIEPELRQLTPLASICADVEATLVQDGTGPDRAKSHADELMADVVGTLTAGPTYAVACLCLRTPGGVRGGAATRTHPSWADRVAVMRDALDALTDASGKARYRQQRQNVVDPVALVVLGAAPDVSPAGELAARRTVDAVLTHCKRLVYAEADAAIQVREWLDGGAGDFPDATVSVRAVVDGAWRWRLANPGVDPARVEQRTVDWCATLAQKGGGDAAHG